MADNKKYYYLKLKENFFDTEEMKILESQKNGIEYQNIYLKMCLLSLKCGGKLAFRDAIPYDLNMLSTVLRVNIDTVKTSIELFTRLNLIDVCDNGDLYMSDLQSLIGRGSSEAERIATYRARINGTTQQSVTMLQNCNTACTPELELELERDLARNNVTQNVTPDRGSFYSHIGKPTPQHILDLAKRKTNDSPNDEMFT